jgi:hypothetical protein
MDPYMERRWHDVHGTLIIYARNQLNEVLGGTGLRSHVEQRLLVEREEEPGDAHSRHIEPDVVSIDTGGGTALAAPPGVVVAEPLRVRVPSEPITQRFIEIRTRTGGQVVTIIEFVSPTNKRRGVGRRQFRRKRRESIAAGIHFVEIDLTRAGRREIPDPLGEHYTALAAANYLAVVYRNEPEDGLDHEAYPMSLREPLPNLGIPLRPMDDDVPLCLQPLIDQCHRDAVFDELDYAQDLRPPLPPADAEWAAARLAAALPEEPT